MTGAQHPPRSGRSALCARVDQPVIRQGCMPRRTLGCFTATFSSIRAAPVGSRRPCSQSCNVLDETPNKSANSPCDIPILALASAAAVSLTLVTRAAWPRRICFTDSSKSFWNISTSDGIFNSLPQLGQKRRRKRIELGFGVDDQQPNDFIPRHKINNAGAATLANSRPRPTHFSTAPAASNHRTGLWVSRDERDELLTLNFRPDLRRIAHEDRRFSNSAHTKFYGSAVATANASTLRNR